MPDPDKGIGGQHGKDGSPQGVVKGGVPKHLRHIYSDLLHKAAEVLRIMLQAVTEFREAGELIQGEQALHPSLKTGPGIFGKIIPIPGEKVVQQYVQFFISDGGDHFSYNQIRNSDII